MKIAAAAPLLALALAASAHAGAHPDTNYASATSANTADRVIEVTPDTRYLNIRDGEVVTIRLGDTSFTLQVSPPVNVTAFPLARIAPAGAPASSAWVYVAPNPTYQNG
jgi:hypothetical protein